MSLSADEDEAGREELVPLVAYGRTGSWNKSSASPAKTTASSSSSTHSKGPPSRDHDQDECPVAPSPERPGYDVEWTDYFPALHRQRDPALGSSSSGSRHRSEVFRRSLRQKTPCVLVMSDNANNTNGNGSDSKDDFQKGTGAPESGSGVGPSTTAAEGAGSSEDALLLNTSKEEVSSDGLGQPSQVGPPSGSSESGDMFQQLRRAHRSPHEAAEIGFSAQQQSDRWIVVCLVAGLYVFFYAIGGLAYYLLDVYGYTVDYSGRANHSNTESFVVGGRQW